MFRRWNNTTSMYPAKMLRLVSMCMFVLAVIGFSTPARAGYFQFSTDATILSGYTPPGSTFTPVSASGPTVTMTTPNLVDITLTGENSNAFATTFGENIDATLPGSDIVFGDIDVSGLTHSSPLENIDIPYVFHITVNDYLDFNFPGSGVQASATFDIAGELMGTVGKTGGGVQVNLSSNTYDPLNVLTKVIGNWVYTLDLNAYVPPGPLNTGTFGAHVSAVPVPEPGTIALLGCGLIALATPAYMRWRRRSRAQAV